MERKNESVAEIVSEIRDKTYTHGAVLSNEINDFVRRITAAHERECLDPIFAKDKAMERLRKHNNDIYKELVKYSHRISTLEDAIKPILNCTGEWKENCLLVRKRIDERYRKN